MYLLYEHHKNPSTGELLATDMLLTSYFPGAPRINFSSAEEKALFELCKLQFKSINAKERTIDMETYIWSFFGNAGQQVYNLIKGSPLASAGIKFERVERLVKQKAAGSIDRPSISTIDPADFFYNQASLGGAPSKDKIKAELEKLLAVGSLFDLEKIPAPDLKKHYRSAAMRLHPDRNGGDAKGMTELNYYWQQWQQFQGVGQ
jgi:hypothetical protein